VEDKTNLKVAPLLRLIFQAGKVVLPVILLSFKDAYKQAALRSAATNAMMGKMGVKSGPKPMTKEEAILILGLNEEKQPTKEFIMEKYNRLFKANDPEKGGSFYIQSKVYRAKEFLDSESG
jgi:mitochondrial import inner membrane translocase subunit TIM16